MVLVAHFRGEDQPRWIDAAGLRVNLQPDFRFLRAVQQPQHAVRRAAQNLKPALDRETREFLRPIETAEHERIIRQAVFRARRRAIGNPLAVVRLIARQAQHLLRVVFLERWRDDPVVRDDVMVEGRAHRARKAQPVHLNRRRPPREHAQARIARMAVHVDENINAVIGNHPRRIVV